MRISARAVIIENGKVLTMFRRRIKNGEVREYYVLPGGGQDAGETLEDTVKRELQEEMNVTIEVLGYLGQMDDPNGASNFYHCKITSGTPHLGGEELDKQSPENYYEPRFVSLDDLDKIDIIGTEFINMAAQDEFSK